MSIFLVILGILLFIGLVLAHEYGHYKLARKNGVDVEEFGLGFPPKIWGKKLKSGMLLSFNLLPLGGFVRLKGEHDADKEKGSFGAATLSAKVKIMLAGVAVNLVIAVGLLTVVAWLGMPKVLENQFTVKSDSQITRNDVLVGYVEPDSPAEKSGLAVGDKLVSINEQTISSSDQLPSLTNQFAGQAVQIKSTRDGNERVLTTQLRSTEEVESSQQTDQPKHYLGVSPSEYTLTRSTWSAPVVAVGLTGQVTKATLQGLGSALSNLFRGDTARASEQVSGPVGIFFLLREGSQLGIQFLLLIIAIISLTLAIMNALPIPALDGGRLFVTLFYRLFRKPLTQKAEERIHGTGFAVLMVLFILITIVDVRRFF